MAETGVDKQEALRKLREIRQNWIDSSRGFSSDRTRSQFDRAYDLVVTMIEQRVYSAARSFLDDIDHLTENKDIRDKIDGLKRYITPNSA